MGYATRHKLSIINDSGSDYTKKIDKLKLNITLTKDYEEIVKNVREIEKLENYDTKNEVMEYIQSDEEDMYYAIESYDEFNEECKWYSHKNDMLILSNKFRDVLFELSGEGEESGDVWKEYYKNGLMQRCEAALVYPEFNESKMK